MVVVVMIIMMIVMIIMPIIMIMLIIPSCIILATRRTCHQRRSTKFALIHLVWLRPPAVRFPTPRADSSGLFHLQWLWNIVLRVSHRAPGPLAGLGPVRQAHTTLVIKRRLQPHSKQELVFQIFVGEN